MKQVFLDSGAFFALLVVEDAFHQYAISLFQRASSKFLGKYFEKRLNFAIKYANHQPIVE